MKRLDVYLHCDLVGHLIQDEHGDMVFDYASSWLESSKARPLSRSLPLRAERFFRKECRGFFAGILPEEGKRKLIAKNLGISVQNDFAMLECIGGECAGAITFMPAGQSLPSENGTYRALSESEFADILDQLPKKPLMAGEEGVRLSLAGVQDKLAVCVKGNEISLPLGNAPSTHILKPAIERYEDVVFNELLCMHLASQIGLPVAEAEEHYIQDKHYLLVERYDRVMDNGHLTRLHQEDFCQAMAIPSSMKYQNEGGPSLKNCFDLLREASSVPVLDLQNLLGGVIFNHLIGSHDAHGKNFSLLYHADGSVRLAPFYDLLSTACYPELSPKMAMKIGGEYRSERVTPYHFERLAEEAGLAKPMVLERVHDMAVMLLTVLESTNISFDSFEVLKVLVQQRCQKAMGE